MMYKAISPQEGEREFIYLHRVTKGHFIVFSGNSPEEIETKRTTWMEENSRGRKTDPAQ